jgi:hypothetical protein
MNWDREDRVSRWGSDLRNVNVAWQWRPRREPRLGRI